MTSQTTPNDIVTLVTLTGGGLSGPMRMVNRLEAVTIGRQRFYPFMFSVDIDQTETGQHIVLHAGSRLIGLIPEARALQMRLDLAHQPELPNIQCSFAFSVRRIGQTLSGHMRLGKQLSETVKKPKRIRRTQAKP